MDREHVKGTADKAKGAIKDTAGKMTGDTKMQAEGKTPLRPTHAPVSCHPRAFLWGAPVSSGIEVA